MGLWLVLLALGLPATEAISAYARISAFNHDYNTVDGDVLFEQATIDDPTTINLGLARLRLVALSYQIRNNSVGVNCNSTGALWGYESAPNAGDLSSKHGDQASVIGVRSLFSSFDDAQLALSGPHSIVGKSFVVFSTSGLPLGCATIVLGSRKQKYAKFVDQSVTGLVSFTQYGSDPTEIAVDVLGLEDEASSIYITRQVTQSGPATPFNFASKAPPAGDLSAKHGSLRSLTRYAFIYTDNDILLTGNESITGMGITLTRVESTVLAWASIEDSYIWPRVYNYPTGPDPDPAPYFVDGGQWFRVLVGLYVACVLSVALIWMVFLARHHLRYRKKFARVEPTRGKAHYSPSLDASSNLLMTKEEDEDKMEMKGYSDHLLGTMVFYCLHSFSGILCLLYFLGIVDWYAGCQFDSLDALCFYGSYPLFGRDANSDLLFTLWCLSLSWFSFCLLTRESLRTWCRLPARKSKCDWVRIRIADPPSQIMTMFPSWVVLRLRVLNYCRFWNYTQYILPVHSTFEGDRYFTFRCQRYLASDTGFSRARVTVATTMRDIQVYAEGLKSEHARSVFQQIGPNCIVVTVQSLGQAIEAEFSRGFYLYQFAIYSIWMWWGYLLVAVSMLCVVLSAAALSVMVTRSNQQTIASIAQSATRVRCLRDSEVVDLGSDEIVPGDVVLLQPESVVPADMILLSGVVVVDESGLTGESRPVRKSATPNSGLEYDPIKHSRHTLFSGTRIVQTSQSDGEARECSALVMKTGIATAKGDLIKHILYPQEMLFKYDEELPVVVGMLLLFGLSCTLGAMYFLITGLNLTLILLWIWCVFTLSQCMSPLLPLALASGPIQASSRLRKLGTFCVDPKRINISGKIRYFCFDKTGTLTKEGLDFIGVHEFREENGEIRNGPNGQINAELTEASILVQYGVATCHAVTAMRDNTLVGNEVETSMFRATGWTLNESANQTVVSNGATQLTVVKRWEFDHTARRMSVLVRDHEGVHHVFTKGAAESVQQRALSVPNNYSTISDAYSLQGLYVLSLGHRKLEGLSAEAAAKMDRADAEQGLEVVSLLLFRNELKPCTTAALSELRQGGVRCVMITGDHAQSGFFIAKASGMLLPNSAVWLSTMRDKEVEWVQLRAASSSEEVKADTDNLQSKDRKTSEDILAMDCELVITGEAFAVLLRSGYMRDLAFRTRVFARMTPDGKVKVIELLISFGLILGMCGDGGNDCGALRTAHCGLALSDAEASVVSPFTSKTKSVQSVVDLLREGRASLATSIATYKFVIGYGLLFGTLGVCTPACGVIICQLGLIFGDSIVVMGLTYAMALTKPQSKLDPTRPTSSLLGPTTIGSVLGVYIIHMIGLLIGYLVLISDPDYVSWPEYYVDAASNWSQGDNWESTLLWSFYVGHVSASALTFSFGGKTRQSLFSNWPVLLAFAIDHCLIAVALLGPESVISHAFHIASHQDNAPHPENEVWKQYQLDGNPSSPAMSFNLRLRLYLILVSASVTAALWEKVVVTGAGARYFQRTRPSPRPQFCL